MDARSRGHCQHQNHLAGAGRILAIDVPVARRAATYHVADPRPDRDAYIAATAEVHGLVVVTRNTADFDPLGCQVINPWSRRDG